MTGAQRTLTDRYRGQRILLTGASGFLGQAILEKMLRALPEIDEIVLFVRPRGRTAAVDRVEEIFRSSLFGRLRRERPDFDDWWRTKVSVTTGALGHPDMGIPTEARAALAERITAILHVGGVAAFDEPLDRVLAVNALGALDVLALARDAGNVPLVYVSTAYVQGKWEGTHAEELLPAGHTPRSLRDGSEPGMEPKAEVARLLERCRMIRHDIEDGVHDRAVTARVPATHVSEERLERLRREYGDKRLARLGGREANKHGWPDPYPMSKALAESLLALDHGSVPVSVVRPAILASTLAEPEPGWLSGLRMADPIIAAMGYGSLDFFPGKPGTILDLVPCDLAVNAVLAALPAPESRAGFRVYHVAGSDTNPLTLRDFNITCRAALQAQPFHDRKGNAIRPSRVKLADSGWVRLALSRKRQWLTVKLVLMDRLGLNQSVQAARSRLRFLRRAHILGRAYAPYTMRQFRFRTTNLDELENALCPEDRRSFAMSVRSVDWTDYLTRIHVPAVRAEAGAAPARAGVTGTP